MTLAKPSRSTPSRRRLFILAGVALLGVLAYYAVRGWDYGGRERRGMEAMERGDYDRSAEVFAQSANAYPGEVKPAFLAAIAFRRAANTDKFEEFLRRAERLGCAPDAIRLQRVLERTQHGLGDAETEALLDQICMRGTSDDLLAAQIYEARAKGYISVYRLDDAFLAVSHWINWQPHGAVARMLRAQLHEDNFDAGRAQADYRAVVEAYPDHLESRIRLADSLVLTRNYNEAAEHYAVSAKLAPQDPRVLVGQAEIEFHRGGDMAGVEMTLTGLLQGELPSELKQRSWIVLSSIYLSRKENEKVVALLEDEAARGELDSRAFESLKRAYAVLHLDDKARQCQERQREVLARREAIHVLQLRITADPRDPEPRYQLGMLLWESGNKSAAATWWRTAILAEPSHRPSHEALADYYAALGDMSRATGHRQLALKLGAAGPASDNAASGTVGTTTGP